MTAWGRWHRRLRALLRRTSIDHEMDEEMRFHVAMEADELRRQGFSDAEARRLALVAFGGVEHHKEVARDARSFGWGGRAARDAAFAMRQMRRAPGFTLAVVATLALGIGATTAIFTVVDAVVLRSLPYADSERLVALVGPSYKGEFVELRNGARTMDLAAHARRGPVSVTGEGEPTRLEAVAASPSLFPLLRVGPILGRTFLEGEERPGDDRVVVMSHGVWQQRFGSDSSAVGRQLVLDGVSRTIVGVMPAGFSFPDRTAQLWIPLAIDPADRVDLWSISARLIGRLGAGVTLAEAQRELQLWMPRMRELFPWKMPADYGAVATVEPLHDRVVGGVRPLMLVLLAAVAVVLLIACANVANLLLTRIAARRRELALRAALGAGRGRLLQQLLAESALLSILGGGLGFLLAVWGVHALRAALPADTPRLEEIAVDVRMLGASLALVVLTTFAAGLLPALRAADADPHTALAEGGRSGSGRSGRRLARVLAGAEIALAVVLATAAGLLFQSLWNMLRVDPGFRAQELVTATVAPPASRYGEHVERREFYRAVQERVGALPAIRQLAIASAAPLGPGIHGSVFVIEGRPDPASGDGEWPWADVRAVVSPEFFRTLDVPIVSGRGFTADDELHAPGAVVIGRGLAARYWPNEDPVGRRIKFPGAQQEWRTIVGVAADVRWTSLTEEPSPAVYLPIGQASAAAMQIVLQTELSPGAAAAYLRSAIASIDRQTAVTDVQTITGLVSQATARPRLAAFLLSLFGAVALALCAIGVYGVFAAAVNTRRREIGVRMAVGAGADEILRLILGQGARLTMVGLAAGLVIAWGVSRLIAGLLFGVQPSDPASYITAALLLGAVALLATYIPARRASRVDPTLALRAD